MSTQKNSIKENLYILAIWIVLFGLLGLAIFPVNVSASVGISGLAAKWQGTQVTISWRTGNELTYVGFNVLRSSSQNGNYVKVNSTMIRAQNFGNPVGLPYSWIDSSVTSGQTYYYKLQTVDASNRTQDDNGPVSAVPSAAPTSTATKVSPTSTRTPTSAPSATPTRTQTYPPGVTPPTAAPTSTPTLTATPQATPTRTQTYPPGVKPPTAAPSATLQKISQAQPVATAQPNANAVVPTVSNNSSGSDSSLALGALPSTDTPPDETVDSADDVSIAQSASMTTLLRLGVIVLSGAMGLGALVFGALAVFLFIRFSRNGS
ncbi:MAG: hypothetical protein HZB51_26760 [Chloroflexi bacterium]|nr:hypothetical protein [Chloroflexota bacterium]